MARIFYLLLSEGGLTGGQKMVLRHVETLRELGFDAAILLGNNSTAPARLDHSAPILTQQDKIRVDDVIVYPDDGRQALETSARRPERAIVFVQGAFTIASQGAAAIEGRGPERLPPFIVVSKSLGARVKRIFPDAQVELVSCFADERRFSSDSVKRLQIVFSPRKRPSEVSAIRALFPRLHPRHAAIPWRALENQTESQVAQALRESAVFLSLNRLESVGITTLEAMRSGCVCAGFLGVGGLEYGTPENGFWVPDDDCEAAADALAQAVDLHLAGGPALNNYLADAQETANLWSYARFRRELEDVWMRLAPEARLSHLSLPPGQGNV